MKNLVRNAISLIIPAIAFLVLGFVLKTYVKKSLGLCFFISSGEFFLATVVVIVVSHVTNKKNKDK
ncbi:MAG: hypothetical protein J6Q32_03835 [Clostridia bacterium]|nr:hypothetical protein [Clostridia bacterium]